MAIVATGTPPGICTIDKRESIPLRARLLIGTPTTGTIVCPATIPGRCAAPPAPAITDLKPSRLCRLGVLHHQVGGSVSRHHPRLMGDREVGEHSRRATHCLPIGVAAHDHAHERIVTHEVAPPDSVDPVCILAR